MTCTCQRWRRGEHYGRPCWERVCICGAPDCSDVLSRAYGRVRCSECGDLLKRDGTVERKGKSDA